MPAAQPLPNSALTVAHEAAPAPLAERAGQPAASAPPARLADEMAVSRPSPVHQLQASLTQITTPTVPDAELLYPGWFRIGFPVASSLALWGAILWGVSRLA